MILHKMDKRIFRELMIVQDSKLSNKALDAVFDYYATEDKQEFFDKERIDSEWIELRECLSGNNCLDSNLTLEELQKRCTLIEIDENHFLYKDGSFT